jgi:hypothetical protein
VLGSVAHIKVPPRSWSCRGRGTESLNSRRGGEPVVGEYLLGGQQRVEAVGLAGASLAAFGPLDLEYLNTVVLEVFA